MPPTPKIDIMAAEKTLAIILRVTEFSETSCIVNLLTRDFGRIGAIAKGARRPKSPFAAAIDVLAVCEIVFINKPSALSILTEAKLERRFRAGETDLKRLYAGYYVIELLRSLTDEGEPMPELFDLTHKMLVQLDESDFSEIQMNNRLLQFELALLELLGQLPMLTRCVSCGREKTLLSDVNFGLNAGGVLCQTCRRGQPNVVQVSTTGFQSLLDLVGAQIGEQESNSDNWNQARQVKERRVRFSNSKTIAQASANEQLSTNEQSAVGDESLTDDLSEIRDLMKLYITHLLGYPPKLYSFMKQV